MSEREAGFRSVLGFGDHLFDDADFDEQKSGKAFLCLVLGGKRAVGFFVGTRLDPVFVEAKAAARERAGEGDLTGLRKR